MVRNHADDVDRQLPDLLLVDDVDQTMAELRHREQDRGAPGEVVQFPFERELGRDRLDDLLQCVAADRARERQAQKAAAALGIAIYLGLAAIAAGRRQTPRPRPRGALRMPGA